MADTATAPRRVPSAVRARSGTDRFRVSLALIAALALGVRLVETLVLRAGHNPDQDAFYYYAQGHILASGQGFIDPVRAVFLQGAFPSAYHPPLFGSFLAAVDWVGFNTLDGNRIACCLLSVASVVLIALVGRRIAGPRVGLLAGLFAALYPPLWVSDAMLLSETMTVFVVSLTLFVAYRFRERASLPAAAGLGAAVALCALTRTELILLFPLVAAPFALAPRVGTWSRRLRMAGVSFLALGVLVGPWVGYNLTRFHHPEFIASGTGAALMSGSCHQVWYGVNIGYWANCGEYPKHRGDESDDDVWFRHRAIHYASSHLDRAPVVVAARVGRLWDVFKPGQTMQLDGNLEGRGPVTSQMAFFSYYVLMPFAIWGLVLMRRRKVAILPLLTLAGIVTFSAATTSGIQRYRTPADVAIAIAAAVGVEAGLEWLFRRPRFARWRGRWARVGVGVGSGA